MKGRSFRLNLGWIVLGLLVLIVTIGIVILAPTSPEMGDWKVKEIWQSEDGLITAKGLISPAGQKGMTISVGERIIYKEWQDQVVKSAVKVNDKWIEGVPLKGCCLFEDRALVLFQMTNGNPQKFKFPIP